MSKAFRKAPDPSRAHLDWLAMIDVSGPFLSLPVLRAVWPDLDPLDTQARENLRYQHGIWQSGGPVREWITHCLRDLLEWGDALHSGGLDSLALHVPEHDTTLTPDFALVEPGESAKPDTTRLLGLITTGHPAGRIKGSEWAATPVDRLAQLCRAHNVELGLATDGRAWVLVWAPRGAVTTTAAFDAVEWHSLAERPVVRAFISLLRRRRFFSVPDEQTLPKLLAQSKGSQEDITEALGVQVRQAVELLATALGRTAEAERRRGGDGLPAGATPHDVYRGAVSVMMRIVFLLFAEENGLLPADNDLYLRSYSAGRLCEELEQQALEGSEEELESSSAAWFRLLALFNAVYAGVDHRALTMHAHDGSMFDPAAHPWLSLPVDDRTVLHMLQSVQYVWMSAGRQRRNRSVSLRDLARRDSAKKGERRKLSFRSLDVEQIGYVYEGLLSFDGRYATDTVVGLVGTEGQEEEVKLRDLERLAAQGDLAAALADRYKDSGIGTAGALEKALASLDQVEREQAERKLLAVTGGDAAGVELARRLLPFYGVIRADLRGLPVVFRNGEVYVTESSLRRNTGTHYTPRELAEQVVEGALEPLIYTVGPLQTADRSAWRPKTSAEILTLKVADIAMGSAAFLVAAARYLGNALVEAWSREGDARAAAYLDTEPAAGAEVDPVVIEARRLIIEHCLYGADINPMAVEMAKLSLWLVSMDPRRPFTFLDDRLVSGDSLLGITSLDQLEVMHMDPVKGRKLQSEGVVVDFTTGIRELVADVAAERRRIADIPLGDDPPAALAMKRALLADIGVKTARVRLFADLAVGAALAHADRGDSGLRDGSLHAANLARKVHEGTADEAEARDKADEWLAVDQVTGSFDRVPIHWPLVFPEVFEQGGFDAVIGNPPFLGGSKITGNSGSSYREYLVRAVGGGKRGNADLVAYFVLRAHSFLAEIGQTGLIATNTLAQGDSREVGLDQLVVQGFVIRKAIKSRPWPSKSATLEYCAVWTSRKSLGDAAGRDIDGLSVRGITTSLEAEFRVFGKPYRLAFNENISFGGSKPDSLGFTMPNDAAALLVEKNVRNSEVLFPYVNGQDLNSRPDLSCSRWIINFHDWSETRAKGFTEAYGQVLRMVKPQREKNNRKVRRERWWQFAERAVALYKAIAGLDRVFAITRVSKTVMPVMLPTGQVFSEAMIVFASEDTAMLALLSSAPHYWWAVAHASSMKADLRYTPSDVFETLPLPGLTQEMRDLGDRLDTFRRDLMLSRDLGLTKTYNLVHSPDNKDRDIAELREIHKAVDEAVCRAYGWDDLIDQMAHGHYDLGREIRYTVAPAVQREFVDRLLELNHERYAEEVARGLHKKTAGKAPGKPKARKSAAGGDAVQETLL
ncbi:hypothetical protein SAMN05421505_101351 [Sinosporangium album]|uniref:site-specific DNA-methyltransferase (adenine-specific) n=1 Tax=Sinosporangium album TaxID=504805 RepID=A0A1G7RCU2_9ACTN|nr:DNA methyltransferase [Sinosporangium album]SDG08474.1 hypothetical protein SAMN05421505_101351 [Sinosporangium album]